MNSVDFHLLSIALQFFSLVAASGRSREKRLQLLSMKFVVNASDAFGLSASIPAEVRRSQHFKPAR
jgi:hypothetical protein